MKRKIDAQIIELLDAAPDYTQLPAGQAEAYHLLMALGEGNHTEQAIVAQLGLKSPLPWRSRLEHLQERGLVRILAVVA
jgi:hypothetical protein